MSVCGFENRYKKFVEQYESNKSGRSNVVMEPTLANQLMNRAPFDFTRRFSSPILLIKDENFPNSMDEINCDWDKRFVAHISDVVKDGQFINRLHKWANEVLDRYLMQCGYEGDFKRILVDEKSTLADYLRRSGSPSSGNEIVKLIKLIRYFASFDATDKKSCNDIGVSKELVDSYGQMLDFRLSYPALLDNVQGIIKDRFSTCGNEQEFGTKLSYLEQQKPETKGLIDKFKIEFLESVSYAFDGYSFTNSWERLHQDYPTMANDYLNKLNDADRSKLKGACSELWDQTYEALANFLLFEWRPMETDESAKELSTYDYCAIVLDQKSGYLRELLVDARSLRYILSHLAVDSPSE